MHKILERQIKRIFGGIENVPAEHMKFLETISKTYEDYEKEYALMERSLNLSSKELMEANKKIQGEFQDVTQYSKRLEQLNKLMVGRELKMAELKKEIKRLKEQLGTDHSKADPPKHDP